MLYTNSLGADKQPNKYSGKELDDLHGLDLYDSQARWYSGAIPGFTTEVTLIGGLFLLLSLYLSLK